MNEEHLSYALYFLIMLFVANTIWMAKKNRYNEIKVYAAIVATAALLCGGMWLYKEYNNREVRKSVDGEGIELWAKVQNWEYGNRHRPNRRRVAPSSMHVIRFEFWIGEEKYTSINRTGAETLNRLESISTMSHDLPIFVRIKYDKYNPTQTILVKDDSGSAQLTTSPEIE